MRFAWPLAFLLLMAPVIVLAVSMLKRRSAAVVFSSLDDLIAVRPTLRSMARPLVTALRVVAMVAIVVALARPQQGVSETRVTTEGVAIGLVVDRSSSMNEGIDYGGERMTRLDVVKEIVRDFIAGDDGDLPGRPNDVLGLVAFAGIAETICPLVRSTDAMVALTGQLETAQKFEDGTAIGDAVALAAARLRKAEEEIGVAGVSERDDDFRIKSKVLVLLTDGRDNRSTINPEVAVRLAADWGIKTYVIGIGSSRRLGGVGREFLRRLAEIGGGRHWIATSGEELKEIYAAIDELERTRIESIEYTEYSEAFMPWAQAAFASLALSILLGSTLLRRVP